MPLADQFHEAADGTRTAAALDELARKLWRAHAEGHLAEADAEAISEAVEARRAALAGQVTQTQEKVSTPEQNCIVFRSKTASIMPTRMASSMGSSRGRQAWVGSSDDGSALLRRERRLL
jgi:hypothetical protein